MALCSPLERPSGTAATRGDTCFKICLILGLELFHEVTEEMIQEFRSKYVKMLCSRSCMENRHHKHGNSNKKIMRSVFASVEMGH